MAQASTETKLYRWNGASRGISKRGNSYLHRLLVLCLHSTAISTSVGRANLSADPRFGHRETVLASRLQPDSKYLRTAFPNHERARQHVVGIKLTG